jgi:3,4-dihydroxy 2-butanone 4-phosphate synthase/GTP cyclohydrolase II
MDSTSFVRLAETMLPTQYGRFRMLVYTHDHVALVVGNVADRRPVLVRMHSECLTGDVFGSHKCDCGEQLQDSLRILQTEGRGILLYLRQEGRGIGLVNKIRAYALQEQGHDTVDANLLLGLPEDARDYTCAADMLRDLGVARVVLLTNNPAKIDALRSHGIEVVERKPVVVPPQRENIDYLRTKRERMGHLIAPIGIGAAIDPFNFDVVADD